ncbi:MAG: tRNA (adenosine(37)-N6)-threonylcarbamoyltransferase complex dimerization subunit type 1 TsaB [Treponema sp.]|nr:tRNA (adenosine(37)-N6)-threonylcarbamoyltransferase complex dimerization subunit type 1 TsaB [Treponema sp.]
MNLLAIDSACHVLSAAVSRGDEIFYEEIDEGMKHSELIINIIDSLMKKASLKPENLNGVLCMGGPGSFTGLRIGYSIAKGLALSLSIPFAPVPTLDCAVFGMSNEEIILAVIQARKSAWFYSFYRNGQKISEEADGDYLQIGREIEKYGERIILTGYGSEVFYDSLPQEKKEKIILKSEKRGYAKQLISIAKIKKLLDNDCSAYLYSGPEYIRLTDAELRK